MRVYELQELLSNYPPETPVFVLQREFNGRGYNCSPTETHAPISDLMVVPAHDTPAGEVDGVSIISSSGE